MSNIIKKSLKITKLLHKIKNFYNNIEVYMVAGAGLEPTAFGL